MTGGHKKSPIFDEEEYRPKEVRSKQQSKPQKNLFNDDNDEEPGYNGFENFDAFNKFVVSFNQRKAKKTMVIRRIVILILPLKTGGKKSL